MQCKMFAHRIHKVTKHGELLKWDFTIELRIFFPTAHCYHNLLIILQIRLNLYAQWEPRATFLYYLIRGSWVVMPEMI